MMMFVPNQISYFANRVSHEASRLGALTKRLGERPGERLTNPMSPSSSLLRTLLLLACVSACGGATPATESTSGGEAHHEDRHQTPAAIVEPSSPSEAPAREDAAALTTPTQENTPSGDASAPTVETPAAATETQQASSDDSPRSAPSSDERENPEPETHQPILAPARAGRIPRRRVQRVLRSHHGEIATCYQHGLEQNPNLQGEVHVRFLVGPDGQVDDAEVFHSTLGSDAVHRCITTAIRSWSFPRPTPRGRSVLLSYPFVLATE